MTAASLRHGPSYFWASYRAMIRFEVLNLRVYLVLAVVVQILIGAGMAVMYGFYLGDLPPDAQRFLVSGIPALGLFPIGFVVVPNAIMTHKLEDTYDFVWSLPVPRLAAAASTLTVYTLLALPGTFISLLVAGWRYGVDLDVSWVLVPAMLWCGLMATSVGFALGHAVPDPRMTNLITNVLIFFVLLFSPIVVPIEQFPAWLGTVHEFLPFYHMAAVLRDAVAEGLVTGVGTSYLVLAVWTATGWAVAAWVVGRRG